MALRAKFRANSVKKSDYGNGQISEELELGAVYGKEGTDNASWAKSTPNGRLTMTISNEAAFGQVVAGKEYFIDITEVTVTPVETPAVVESSTETSAVVETPTEVPATETTPEQPAS